MHARNLCQDAFRAIETLQLGGHRACGCSCRWIYMMDTLKAVAPNLPSSGALNSETEELVPSFMGNLIRHF
jgi:hypothetical protein